MSMSLDLFVWKDQVFYKDSSTTRKVEDNGISMVVNKSSPDVNWAVYDSGSKVWQDGGDKEILFVLITFHMDKEKVGPVKTLLMYLRTYLYITICPCAWFFCLSVLEWPPRSPDPGTPNITCRSLFTLAMEYGDQILILWSFWGPKSKIFCPITCDMYV